MIDTLRDFIVNLIHTFRVADLVDVLLVAFLFYVVLSWMRRSMSPSALRGIGVVVAIFTALYVPARFFDMYLIGRATEVLFAVLLLVTIVVFQSDLRRMLDRAGARLFTRRTPAEASKTSTVDLLIEAVAKLAETSTGALIAIRGRDPWEHHVQGGVELDGIVSPPLLYGIFDHRTPGHDGALLLEGERVTTFAAHLPLATHQPQVSRYGGTRHAAALGLAEVCDAFVIVVSEERGTISVAHEGKINEVDTAAKLKEQLTPFWQEHYGEAAHLREDTWSRRGIQTAALSVALSALLWGIFAYNPEIVYRSFDVPIEYRDMPSSWLIEGEVTTARVMLSGPDQAFRAIDPSQLVLSFSMEQPQEGGNDLTVDRSNLNLPDQVVLESVDPPTVRVDAHPLASTVLPVVVPSSGDLPDGLQLDSLRAEPDSVTVLVPEGSAYDHVVADTINLDSIYRTTTVERALMRPDDMRFPEDGATTVTVRVTVRSGDADDGG